MSLDVLSLRDQEQFDQLKQFGVLQSLETHLLEKHKQTYIIFCGDGKHSLDLTAHHVKHCGISHETDHDLFHEIALNGGALCIPPTSPLSNLENLPQDLVALMNLEYALMLKGNDGQIAVYDHAPCGAAKLAGFDFIDIIDNGLRAKVRIRTIFPNPLFRGTIGCYTHVCKSVGNGVKRNTYFVSKAKWEEWLTLPGNEARACDWNAYKAYITKHSGWTPNALLRKLALIGQ